LFNGITFEKKAPLNQLKACFTQALFLFNTTEITDS
jgi:hypothetical protein